jgi:hypothetical protein
MATLGLTAAKTIITQAIHELKEPNSSEIQLH